jgi:hypothetical protein
MVRLLPNGRKHLAVDDQRVDARLERALKERRHRRALVVVGEVGAAPRPPDAAPGPAVDRALEVKHQPLAVQLELRHERGERGGAQLVRGLLARRRRREHRQDWREELHVRLRKSVARVDAGRADGRKRRGVLKELVGARVHRRKHALRLAAEPHLLEHDPDEPLVLAKVELVEQRDQQR